MQSSHGGKHQTKGGGFDFSSSVVLCACLLASGWWDIERGIGAGGIAEPSRCINSILIAWKHRERKDIFFVYVYVCVCMCAADTVNDDGVSRRCEPSVRQIRGHSGPADD